MHKLIFRIGGGTCLILAIVLCGYYAVRDRKTADAIPNRTTTDQPAFRVNGVPEFVPLSQAPTIGLPQIFSADHSWTADLPHAKTVSLIATGDVLLARSVNYKMVFGNGFLWPFEKTNDMLASADVTVINLETPLLADCPPTQTGMSFCGDKGAAAGLIFAGVDIVTLGNNHMGNFGRRGVEETERILNDAGIEPVGIGPVYRQANGIRFAFLSYNDIGHAEDGVSWADDGTIRKEIGVARKNADVVVVSPHWGIEYVTQPTERQRQLGHLMIDAGADVVLGNHPHWIQPVEIYKGKFIMYAHGNFVFDQEWSEETKTGVVGRYTFYEGRLVDVEFLPVRIVDYGQPYFLAGEEKQQILRDLETESKALVADSVPY